VDDSSVIRRTIRCWIESKTDWKVCGEAGDGETAVYLVKLLNPDFVILDIAMPLMDGLKAAKEIVAITPHPQIIVLTNYPSDLVQKYARRIGIKAVLAKDGESTLDRLVSIIQKLPEAA